MLFRLPASVFTLLCSVMSQVSAQFHDQPGVYDGREHIPGQIVGLSDEGAMEQAAAAGQIIVVDRVFPPQIMVQFLESITWSNMPGNTTTDLELPTMDEVVLGSQPYSEWALPPFDTLEGEVFTRTQIRIASHEDTTGLQVVDKSIAFMKQRLWEDVMPLSRNQWHRKHLNDPENFDLACEYLTATVNAFAYLNMEAVRFSLEMVFNNIAAEWASFDDALNAARATRNEALVSTSKLWEEYVRKRWHIMVTRTHAWVLEHVDALRDVLFDQLRQTEPAVLDTMSTEQWNITNKLHILAEIVAQAGYTIVMPMNEMTHYQKPENPEYLWSELSIEMRAEEYSKLLKQETRKRIMDGFIADMINGTNDAASGIADPASMIQSLFIQKEEQKRLRDHIATHATVPLVAEEWILWIKRYVDSPDWAVEKWGFVIYRLTYSQYDEEWDAYLKALNSDVNDWGDGILGADLVRDKAQLKWIDGRDVGIAEGDVEGAKAHFLGMTSQEDFQDKSDWDQIIFLYADLASVDSYLHQSLQNNEQFLPHGDFGGFVTAVDAPFDPADPGEHAEESPGFTGRMRIAGSLLWSDLFALGKMQAASAEDLWPLAMHHPWQMYVGPVVERQRCAWDKTKEEQKGHEMFESLVASVGL